MDKNQTVLEPEALRRWALWYLSRYVVSESRFLTAASRKTDHPHDLLTEMKALGYLDDKAFAKGVAQGLLNRGTSKAMITQKMYNRGLKKEDIKNAIDVFSDDDEINAAKKQAKRKKWGAYSNDSSKEKKMKDYQAIIRAGFNSRIASDILSGNAFSGED